jgi:hypothetical protein
LKDIKDGNGGSIGSVGEWVVAEIFPGLFGVLCQGMVEKRLEVGGRGGRIGGRGRGIMGRIGKLEVKP